MSSVNSCEGKKQYLSFTEASRAAKKFHRRFEVPKEPYKCRYCQRWHIGDVSYDGKKAFQRSTCKHSGSKEDESM